MTHWRFHWPVVWIGVILALDGCVSVSASYPEKHLYVLEVGRQGKPLEPVEQTVLKIQKFRISPSFEGKQFVYRTSDAQYEADFYHEWFILPNAMLTQQVLNWLTMAGRFQYVMDTSAPVSATHKLEGNVTALYGDYRGSPAKAVLGLQFFLVYEATQPAPIMLHQKYRREVDLSDQSPEALVNGWNEALRRILTAFEEDLNRTVKHQSQESGEK